MDRVKVREREVTGQRLLTASARHSFDPEVEVDWGAPLRDGAPFMPLQRVSLYGTPLWERLSTEQRIELSRHEIASVMSVGLWFEVILMQLLSRYVYNRDLRQVHLQYALTELGDETRHSVMFAKAVSKLECPDYRPGQALHQLGKLFGHVVASASMFTSVLVAEEVTDRLQREMMHDESLQPLTRTISRIHVIEEGRHVRYAREELARLMPTLGRSELAWHRTVSSIAAYLIIDNLVQSRVYSAVGIDPRVGRKAALANPHHRQTRRWMGEKITRYLDEVGMIGPTRPVWRKAHLLA
jgi:hypothetical protein